MTTIDLIITYSGAILFGIVLGVEGVKANLLGAKPTESRVIFYPAGQDLNKEQPGMLRDGWAVESVVIGGVASFGMMTTSMTGPGSGIIVTYKRTVK